MIHQEIVIPIIILAFYVVLLYNNLIIKDTKIEPLKPKRYFFFVATFDLSEFRTTTASFTHVREFCYPCLKDLENEVNYLYKEATNIVILSITECLTKKEYDKFISEQY